MPATQTDRITGLTTSVAVKAPCRVVSNAPVTFTGSAPYGFLTIGGVTVSDNATVSGGTPDRVLLNGQVDQTQNGIWLVSALSWTRALDFDGPRDAVQGTLVEVYDAVAGSSWYRLTTSNPVIIGTSNIAFEALDVIASGTGGLGYRTVYFNTPSPDVTPADHGKWILADCGHGGGGNITIPFRPNTLDGMKTKILRRDSVDNAHSVIVTDGSTTLVTLSTDDLEIDLMDQKTFIQVSAPRVPT